MEQKLNSIPPDGAAAQKQYEAEFSKSSQTIRQTPGLSVCPGMIGTGVRLYNRWALFVSKGSRKPLVICRN